MQTIATKVTDGVHEMISREAARRGVSIDEVIDDLLLEGESSLRNYAASLCCQAVVNACRAYSASSKASFSSGVPSA